MSVPTFQRSENKLQALKDTMSMTAYTIHMCENEKIFPNAFKAIQELLHIRKP